jgi:hypothetical protein
MFGTKNTKKQIKNSSKQFKQSQTFYSLEDKINKKIKIQN